MKPYIDLRLLINSSIDETVTLINITDKSIKRQTNAIAASSNKPIINNVFGTRLNTLCYHFESYHERHFNRLINLL